MLKKIILPVILIIVLAYFGIRFFRKPRVLDFSGAKTITLTDDGLAFEAATSAETVGEFLKESKIDLNDHDELLPNKDSRLFPNVHIFIRRAIAIKIEVDGKTIHGYTLGKTVGEALAENGVKLGPLDKISPAIDSLPQENMDIVVTRINVVKKTVTEDIAFPTQYTNDPKLNWREQKITQPGIKGKEDVEYRITYKNGEEISRVALSKTVTQEPTPQIVTQGTYMKLGSAERGAGTWYAYMGGMFAASTTIPKGSYAKVTDMTTGRSIVVQINDYGPQGKGRIIDLDKVAFQKLAPLGAGIINVKVEPILN